MPRNVGDPLLDAANFVLATRPRIVATRPIRRLADDQFVAPLHDAARDLCEAAAALAMAAQISAITMSEAMPLTCLINAPDDDDAPTTR